jgi:hypothetical protein
MSSAIYHSKHRKYNGKAKKDKKTNNDLENTTQKTKFPVTGTRTGITSGALAV